MGVKIKYATQDERPKEWKEQGEKKVRRGEKKDREGGKEGRREQEQEKKKVEKGARIMHFVCGTKKKHNAMGNDRRWVFVFQWEPPTRFHWKNKNSNRRNEKPTIKLYQERILHF